MTTHIFAKSLYEAIRGGWEVGCLFFMRENAVEEGYSHIYVYPIVEEGCSVEMVTSMIALNLPSPDLISEIKVDFLCLYLVFISLGMHNCDISVLTWECQNQCVGF